MARCYSACVRHRHPPQSPLTLPRIWLISDARIDNRLHAAIEALPARSGFIFRHYHLPPAERRVRFQILARHARRHGHMALLAGPTALARRWGADGAYGSAGQLARGPGMLRLVTAHDLRELAAANRCRADAVLLSPVFPTRSHPGAPALGPVRFRLLASRATVPAIALGGMDAMRARRLDAICWAAIDSLAQPLKPSFPIHS